MKNTCSPLSREDANSMQRAGRAVAPGAAGLLVVGLDRARHRLVADRAHVGLVDAHPERVGRHDDVDVAVHEAPLRVGALLARQARVVGHHRRAELVRQPRRQLVALRARARVDDRGQRARLLERRRDAAVAGLLGRARDDDEREVRAVEAGRDPDRIAQPEPRDDVVGDLRGRRRGRRDDRLRAEPARGIGQAEVVGPEVVPPLRDAVRLVDHEQADPRLPDPLEEAGRGEALGRDVEQPRAARDGAVDRGAVGCRVLLRVDERDRARARRARAPRPGPASATRAARPRASGPPASAPAAGSRATCPSRWASRRARRARRWRPRPPRAGRGGSPRSRTPRAAPRRARSPARTAAAAQGPGRAEPARSAGR